MRLIALTIRFYLYSIIFDSILYLVVRMKPYRRSTAFFARCAENIAVILKKYEYNINEIIENSAHDA